MSKKLLYIIFITTFTSYLLNGEYINYKVKNGDTLFKIAFDYNMNVDNFLKINKIADYKKYNLKIGNTLKVTDNRSSVSYKVKSGDTLLGIAYAHDMNANEFYKLNKIDSKYLLKIGDNLKVYKKNNSITKTKEVKKVVNKTDTKDTINYKVKNGDTLLGIAYAHDMNANEFYKLNKINSKYMLKFGDNLKVYKKNNSITKTKEVKKVVNKTDTEGTINYKVKNGDTLSEIALAHNMDLIDIYSINNLNNKYVLKFGDNLKVYKKSNNSKKVVAIYIAKNGDNLYSIAKKNNMTFNQLAQLNSMKNPNAYKLKIGEKLKVNKTVIIAKSPPKKEVNTSLPKSSFMWPYRGSVIVGYGVKNDKTASRGISISAKIGSKVLASDDGVIEYASNIRGFGNVVIIKHKNNYTTSYAHLSNINVKLGETIKKGEAIGVIGDTGLIDDYRLYFRISYKGKPINPMRLLPKG